MKINLHTHTERCGHASGADEEFVLAAIAAGFTTLGFSDHTQFPYEDGYVNGTKMLPEELESFDLDEIMREFAAPEQMDDATQQIPQDALAQAESLLQATAEPDAPTLVIPQEALSQEAQLLQAVTEPETDKSVSAVSGKAAKPVPSIPVSARFSAL